MNYTQRRLEEFAYQLKRTKECQIVLDHNPVWCGDCFACSECGKIFITASVANKSIAQAIAEERERMRGIIDWELTPHGYESDDPQFERFAIKIKEKYKNKILATLQNPNTPTV